MDQKSDLIREDIDETRSQLTEKLEVLEGQIRGTVESAKSTVEDTIENVRENLRKFTPSYQVQEHPLLYLGGVVAAGVLVGRGIAKRSETAEWRSELSGQYGADIASLRASEIPATSEYEEVANTESPFHLGRGVSSDAYRTAAASVPSLLEKFRETFKDEIGMVKGMAMSALMASVRDFAKRTAPNLESQIDQVMDSAMQKFGVVPPEGRAQDTQTKGDELNSEWKDQYSPKQEENLTSKVV